MENEELIPVKKPIKWQYVVAGALALLGIIFLLPGKKDDQKQITINVNNGAKRGKKKAATKPTAKSDDSGDGDDSTDDGDDSTDDDTSDDKSGASDKSDKDGAA